MTVYDVINNKELDYCMTSLTDKFSRFVMYAYFMNRGLNEDNPFIELEGSYPSYVQPTKAAMFGIKVADFDSTQIVRRTYVGLVDVNDVDNYYVRQGVDPKDVTMYFMHGKVDNHEKYIEAVTSVKSRVFPNALLYNQYTHFLASHNTSKQIDKRLQEIKGGNDSMNVTVLETFGHANSVKDALAIVDNLLTNQPDAILLSYASLSKTDVVIGSYIMYAHQIPVYGLVHNNELFTTLGRFHIPYGLMSMAEYLTTIALIPKGTEYVMDNAFVMTKIVIDEIVSGLKVTCKVFSLNDEEIDTIEIPLGDVIELITYEEPPEMLYRSMQQKIPDVYVNRSNSFVIMDVDGNPTIAHVDSIDGTVMVSAFGLNEQKMSYENFVKLLPIGLFTKTDPYVYLPDKFVDGRIMLAHLLDDGDEDKHQYMVSNVKALSLKHGTGGEKGEDVDFSNMVLGGVLGYNGIQGFVGSHIDKSCITFSDNIRKSLYSEGVV